MRIYTHLIVIILFIKLVVSGKHRSSVNGYPNDPAMVCGKKALSALSHLTTSEMVNNLDGPYVMIMNVNAHGNIGLFTTGCGGGSNVCSNDNMVHIYNEGTWGPELDKLKNKAGIMRVYSCNTGEGQDGADLAYNMATRTSSDSRGIYWNHGEWQVANPSGKPTPISCPVDEHKKVSLIKAYNKTIDFDLGVIDWSKLHKITKYVNIPKFQVLTKEDLVSWFTGHVEEYDGIIMGMVTGKLTYFENRSRKTATIWNNNWLEFNDKKGTIYGFKSPQKTKLKLEL